MLNKKFFKFLYELKKLDANFNIFDQLNSFQITLLSILNKKKELQNSFIFSQIKSNLSRAQKYRAYKELVDKKYIIKKSKKTLINI